MSVFTHPSPWRVSLAGVLAELKTLDLNCLEHTMVKTHQSKTQVYNPHWTRQEGSFSDR